jgi:hypothetical protein
MIRIVLFFLTLLAALLFSARSPQPVIAFWLVTFIGGALLAGQRRPRLCVTLTFTEILADVMMAFKTRVPELRYFGTDMSNDQVKFGQQVIAHLPAVPTAYDHVAASGYSLNAQNARDLLTDVPITINGWKDVPIKITTTDASQDRSKNYLKTISNAGYVLGKAVVDFALGKALAANFSQSTAASAINTSKDTLNKVRVAMNLKKALSPRYMIIGSDAFSALDNDPRISSGDYYGQRIGSDPFGTLYNLAGFTEIREYPEFPTNNENLSALGFDQRAIGIATRVPMDSTDLARELGLPVTYKAEVVQDPETGLAIAGFGWIDSNTHDIYIVSSVMYGAVAGSQGGAAGAILDYAGHRIVTP